MQCAAPTLSYGIPSNRADLDFGLSSSQCNPSCTPPLLWSDVRARCTTGYAAGRVVGDSHQGSTFFTECVSIRIIFFHIVLGSEHFRRSLCAAQRAGGCSATAPSSPLRGRPCRQLRVQQGPKLPGGIISVRPEACGCAVQRADRRSLPPQSGSLHSLSKLLPHWTSFLRRICHFRYSDSP